MAKKAKLLKFTNTVTQNYTKLGVLRRGINRFKTFWIFLYPMIFFWIFLRIFRNFWIFFLIFWIFGYFQGFFEFFIFLEVSKCLDFEHWMDTSLYGRRMMNVSVQHHLPLSRTMRRSTIVLTVVLASNVGSIPTTVNTIVDLPHGSTKWQMTLWHVAKEIEICVTFCVVTFYVRIVIFCVNCDMLRDLLW